MECERVYISHNRKYSGIPHTLHVSKKYITSRYRSSKLSASGTFRRRTRLLFSSSSGMGGRYGRRMRRMREKNLLPKNNNVNANNCSECRLPHGSALCFYCKRMGNESSGMGVTQADATYSYVVSYADYLKYCCSYNSKVYSEAETQQSSDPHHLAQVL